MSRRAPRALPGKRSIQNPSTDAMFWTLLGIVIAGTHSMVGCAAVPANAGQGDRLLNRKADVRAAQHEGQVIKRGRNHWGPGVRTRWRAVPRPRECEHALPESRLDARLRAE